MNNGRRFSFSTSNPYLLKKMPTNGQNANKRSGVRLQKILADAGLCSRRQAETLIEDGEVRVNGRIAVLGQKANPENDTSVVRGKNLSARNGSVLRIVQPSFK